MNTLRILIDNKFFSFVNNKSIEILLSLFVSEECLGQQGLGRVHLGVCPQVYLQLLYLVGLYIEHSLGFMYYGD